MAGSNAAFDPAAFRTAIRNTMTMGLPVDTAERATFRWDDIRNFDKTDTAGNPFDWTVDPDTEITFPDVQVPVAVEFKPADGLNTPVGQFDTNQATITILDEDFEQITVDSVMANKVLLGGNTYTIEYVAPPMGLFEVTVYQIFVKAVDES